MGDILIKYIGHAGFILEGSQTIVIDPFISGNPKARVPVEKITKADLVLVTHDHLDHLGDSEQICKNTGAPLVAIHEIAVELADKGIRAEGMNIGGTLKFDDVKINMVEAKHSSMHGHQAGFVIEMDGATIYHSGDTSVFSDMALISKFFNIDLALLPIGDRYTMGIKSAAYAVELLKPAIVIPMHYNTFPLIEAEPEEFKKLVGDKSKVEILSPGQTYKLSVIR